MKISKIYIILFPIFLSSCGFFAEPYHDFFRVKSVQKDETATDSFWSDTSYRAFQISCPDPKEDKDCKADTVPIDNERVTFDEIDNQHKRNYFMFHLIKHSDRLCQAYQTAIFSSEKTTNLSLGVASGILTSVATLATPAMSARWLTGAASITDVTRLNINETLYSGLLSEAIIKRIDDLRAKELAELRTRSKESLDGYNPQEMLRDINVYNTYCSFHQGIRSLVTDKNIRETSASLKEKITDLETQIAGAKEQRSETEQGKTSEIDILDINIARMTQQLSSLRERLGFMLSDTEGEVAPDKKVEPALQSQTSGDVKENVTETSNKKPMGVL